MIDEARLEQYIYSFFWFYYPLRIAAPFEQHLHPMLLVTLATLELEDNFWEAEAFETS